MKKIKILIVICILIVSFIGCKNIEENTKSESNTFSNENGEENLNDFNDTYLQEYENSANDVFKELPQHFVFSSGVGNWSTKFDLSSDGTFTGKYSDLDMGDIGENFSNGTASICKFNGKFSAPAKIDEQCKW